ncbi:MAG: SIMPL domain-containing protein [Muribaculaceae bacterium]|nr:SIMPL domain-containing protein [Muribaculaceae bacterium]
MYDRLRGNVTIFGFLVCAGLIVLGIFLRYGLTHLNDSHRTVTVRGLCEREVKANKVTWPIVSKEVGNYLPSLFANIENTNSLILKFLKENGIEDSEISVNPPAVVDLQADRYSYNQNPYRYNVTNVIVVTSSKVEKINELIKKQAELLKQGVAIVAGDYQYQTLYEYTDLNTIKPEMIEEATINARAAADKFAEDSGSKVGRIQTASQGQFSIEDRDQYTPYIKKIRVVSSINYYLED